MSPRIKQLAEQARQDYLKHHWPSGISADSVGMYPQLMERFAELIVQECADICNQAVQQSQLTRDLLQEDELAEKMVAHGAIAQAQRLVASIQQHFGVEP